MRIFSALTKVLRRVTFPVAIFAIVSCGTNAAQAALIDGLQGYYDFEGDANNKAVGGTLPAGTLTNGAATSGGTPRAGTGALNLDGANDYLNIGALAANVPTTSSWTISTWFRPDIAPTTTRFMVYESVGNYGMSYGLRDGTTGNTNFQLFVNAYTPPATGADSSQDVQVADGVVPATWYHIVETFDASTNSVTGYLNGVATYSIALGAKVIGSSTTPLASALNVGTYRTANDRFFDGSIDELGIWNRALTSTEATQLFALGTAGNAIIPEPSTYALLACGLAGALTWRRRK